MRFLSRVCKSDIGQVPSVILSRRAHAAIVAETFAQHPNETGGILLGHHCDGLWHVLEAIDPGPGSHFSPHTFAYDTAYVNHLARKVAGTYERPLALIGLWHRHPGSVDRFSPEDDITNQRYASQSPEGAISCLINLDPHFRITAYHVPHNLNYRRLPHRCSDDAIPAVLREPRRSSCLLPERLAARQEQQMVQQLLAAPIQPAIAGPLSPSLAALTEPLLELLEEQRRFAYGLRRCGPCLDLALVPRQSGHLGRPGRGRHGGCGQQLLRIRDDSWGQLRIQAADAPQDDPFAIERLRALLQGVHDG